MAAFDDVAQFRKAFLAFWRGKYKALPLHSTSVIAPQKSPPYSQLTAKEITRLEVPAALGCIMRKNFRAYAVAWAYDFEGGSRRPEAVAKRFGVSVATFHRLVREFWEALYQQCHGLAPGERNETFERNGT